MSIYFVCGRDSSSDWGSFLMVIEAKDNRTARKIAKQELADNGREELKIDSVQLSSSRPVLFSNLDTH